MQLAYFHVAADAPEKPMPDAAVVIDVLRATTTIAWALHNGAEAVQTFADLDDLRSSASKWNPSKRLLIGERGGQKLKGFDLGNSPVAVVPELVRGKRLFMSTTNGTKSLQRVREAPMLLTLSLPNRSAIAKRLLREKPTNIWILGSGWEGSYSLEDSLAAGALAAFLLNEANGLVSLVNDEITAAFSLWNQWKHDPEACLREATHGKRLVGIGDHDADFKCCADLDSLSVVPSQKEPGVLVPS